MSGQKFVTSLDALAQKLGVSTRAVGRWSKQYADFPQKTKSGYSVAGVRDFAKRHGLGPYRFKGGNGHATTLTSARLKYLEERTTGERLRNSQEEVKAGELLGEVVLMADVLQLYEQTASAVATAVDSLADAIDRELPKEVLPTDSWPVVRERCVDAGEKVAAQARALIMELLADDSNLEQT